MAYEGYICQRLVVRCRRQDAGRAVSDVSQDIRERVVALETNMGHVATKADIANLQVWVLSALVAVAGIAVAVTRFI